MAYFIISYSKTGKPLRKAFAIFMLFVFSFNVGGYYIVFWALQHQYNLKIASIIDSGSYVKEETIEFKVPMSLPYPLQPRDFERISGKFEYNGEFYELVEQKLDKDTLRVVCLKNHDQKQLVSTINNYVNLTNDLPGTEQKAYNFLSKLLKDYKPETKVVFIEATSWLTAEIKFDYFDSADISTLCREIPSPPPKA